MVSSSIGQFVIGVSPIGGAVIPLQRAVISQYANSPILLELIENFASYFDAAARIETFYDMLWNVDTAQGYGLDVWGRIVGVGRVLQIPDGKFFGFEEATDTSADPFGQSPYFSGGLLTSNFSLADDAYRLLILAKAAANIWDGSVPGLNNILRLLFPGQVCYVVDNQDMTIEYTFEFPLTPVQLAVVANSGILPRPCGVSATVVQI